MEFEKGRDKSEVRKARPSSNTAASPNDKSSSKEAGCCCLDIIKFAFCGFVCCKKPRAVVNDIKNNKEGDDVNENKFDKAAEQIETSEKTKLLSDFEGKPVESFQHEVKNEKENVTDEKEKHRKISLKSKIEEEEEEEEVLEEEVLSSKEDISPPDSSRKTPEGSEQKNGKGLDAETQAPTPKKYLVQSESVQKYQREVDGGEMVAAVAGTNQFYTLVSEPLLYTQSDLDEVIKSRENEWHKKCQEIENKVKEEIAMRELLEQDHRERIESLKKENNEMKLVVAHYEKTIVELTENSHHNHMYNEETLSETVRAKEQLQQDLHSAETNLVDAYKRIEKLKLAIDTYKSNEDNLKASVNEFQIKLKRSEDRYQKLKNHAAEKVEAANIEINKVRKQKEIDLAGLQAGLKRAQSKINSLEQEVQQKTRENAEFAQICDDLIKKVSGD